MHFNAIPSIADSNPPSDGRPVHVDALITRYVPIAPRRFVLKGLLRRLVQVTVPGLFLSLAACGGNVEPTIHLNPDPSMLYDVTVKVDDATFDVDQIEARANYKVKNEACVPLTPVSGVKIAPIKTIQLDARKVDDFTYRFAVYADALQDEDYFGQGMCHWSLEAATFFGHRAGRTISAHLFADDMFVAKQVVLYYPRTWVLAPPGGFTESGTPSADTYRDPSNVFTIRVEAKERKR